jgi:hypothetical protein
VPGAVSAAIVLHADCVPRFATGSNAELAVGSPVEDTVCGGAEPKAIVPVLSVE